MNAKTRDLILTTVAAIILGLVVAASCLLFIGASPLEVFSQAIKTLVTDAYTLGDVFLKSTPLIFVSLAFAFTYKANLFNIGAQGQFYMGCLAAVSISLALGGLLPGLLVLVLSLLGSILAGGAVGAGIGYLKAKFKANEFLVSMMSTYVVLALMNYLLRTFLMESKGEYPQTDAIVRDTWIPSMFQGTRMHWGFVLAVIAALGVWVLLNRTTLGFRIRAVGASSTTAFMSGIEPNRITIIAFFISGALAGMAGLTEVNGVQHMLIQNFNTGLGSAGIGIAILANGHPIGIIFASLLFGSLSVIGNIMGRMPGLNIPSSIIDLMQGSVMLFVIASHFVRQYIGNRRAKKEVRRAVEA